MFGRALKSLIPTITHFLIPVGYKLLNDFPLSSVNFYQLFQTLILLFCPNFLYYSITCLFEIFNRNVNEIWVLFPFNLRYNFILAYITLRRKVPRWLNDWLNYWEWCLIVVERKGRKHICVWDVEREIHLLPLRIHFNLYIIIYILSRRILEHISRSWKYEEITQFSDIGNL